MASLATQTSLPGQCLRYCCGQKASAWLSRKTSLNSLWRRQIRQDCESQGQTHLSSERMGKRSQSLVHCMAAVSSPTLGHLEAGQLVTWLHPLPMSSVFDDAGADGNDTGEADSKGPVIRRGAVRVREGKQLKVSTVLMMLMSVYFILYWGHGCKRVLSIHYIVPGIDSSSRVWQQVP